MPSFEEIPASCELELLEAKAKSIKRNAIIGVVVGAAGLFLFFSIIFGIILGAYAIHSGRDALTDINVYGVERKYKRVAQAAQLLGIFAIVLPVATIIMLLTQR